MPKDINDNKFPDETKLKLEIFSQCFREWFPVFIYNSYISRICICDFFAGSGTDTEGSHGSPLILLDEARKKGYN
jgi:three-Cys-motif partner protein